MKKIISTAFLLFVFSPSFAQLQMESQVSRTYSSNEIVQIDSLEFIYNSPTQGLLNENIPFIQLDIRPGVSIFKGASLLNDPINYFGLRSPLFEVDQITQHLWQDSSFQVYSAQTYYEGNLDSVIFISPDTDVKYLYAYNNDSLLSSITSLQLDSNSWVPYRWEYFEYNASGQVTNDSVVFADFLSTPTSYNQHVMKTNYTNGRISSQIWKNNGPAQYRTHEYDILGRLTSTLVVQDTIYTERFQYNYGPTNLLLGYEYDFEYTSPYLDSLIGYFIKDMVTSHHYTGSRLDSSHRVSLDDSVKIRTNYQYLNNDFLKRIETNYWTPSTVNKTEVYFNYINEEQLTIVETKPILEFHLEVYPNPTTDFVHLESNAPIESVQLVDLNGRTFITQTGSHKLDVRNLSKGVYVVWVKSENRYTSSQIVIQ